MVLFVIGEGAAWSEVIHPAADATAAVLPAMVLFVMVRVPPQFAAKPYYRDGAVRDRESTSPPPLAGIARDGAVREVRVLPSVTHPAAVAGGIARDGAVRDR